MNGSQDPRQSYPGAPEYQAPPNAAPPAAPPVWPQNAYDPRASRPPVVEDPRRKSPSLALILSAMPGLGQIYVGYYQQGFVHMLVVAIVIFLLNAPGHHHGLEAFLGFFLAFFWLYNMIDAYRRASFYNHTLAGLTGYDLPPEDIKLPKGSGSMAGGVALIGIGLLFFANTALGMSLDWLDQWWPMALVLMGVYLVYNSMAAKQRAAEAARTQAASRPEEQGR